jgi:putative membrane protein
MIRKPMLAAGLAAGLALSMTAAQAQSTNMNANPKSPAANSPAMNNNANNNANKADKDSQSFIKTAIEGNIGEVDAGKLAQEKGKSDAVKQFGAMLVKDHSAANEKAKQVAGQLGVDPPTGSKMSAKATYLKLKVLSGDSFDRSFASSMVSDHQADIKDYQKASAKNDAAGAYAKETLPTLQEHLKEAQSLVRETTTTGQGSSKK